MVGYPARVVVTGLSDSHLNHHLLLFHEQTRSMVTRPHNLTKYPKILGLPPEILIHVLSYLEWYQLVSVQAVGVYRSYYERAEPYYYHRSLTDSENLFVAPLSCAISSS